MSNNEIRSLAEKISRLDSNLLALRAQRAMLGTGPTACAEVTIIVEFGGHGSQRVRLSPDSKANATLMSSKDMMALALSKAWDARIDEAQRELATAAARLAEVAKAGAR